MRNAGRNQAGLTERQIAYCLEVWEALCAGRPSELDTTEATQYASRTRFVEEQNKVILGADALPGKGVDANSRLSPVACLAHELAHVERFDQGYRRPTGLPDLLVDEAEASLRASFMLGLTMKTREDLIEDARDLLIQWLALARPGGNDDEG
jgi:hypothetical protein